VGDVAGYQRSLSLVSFHFESTGTPALVAKCEQLAQVARAPAPAEARTSALRTFSGPNDTANDALADDDVTVAPVERSELTARR
jgi:hypothetical protein